MLDLSRVPHLEERKRLSDLIDQRAAIEEEHAALLEPKVAAIDAEYDAILERLGQSVVTGWGDVAKTCKATGLLLLENDDVVHSHQGVFLMALLPPEAVANLTVPEPDEFEDEELVEDEQEAA